MYSRSSRALIGLILAITATQAAGASAAVPALVNPGFEQVDAQGVPAGWTILTGLDPHRYGPPDLKQAFDAIAPAQGVEGYHSPHCLSFPEQGTWFCPVFNHANADDRGINGKELGKAAVFQTIDLPAGRYRFAVRLRTADGARYSAGFRLGVNHGEPAEYAHDGSTGIHWTPSVLGVRRTELGGMEGRGEWTRYQTEPFTLEQPGAVTVWIRLDYVNENQFASRWQADDAAILAFEGPRESAETHRPCERTTAVRFRSFPGDDESYLVDAGDSKVVEAPEKRLFRSARELQPGQSLRFSFPTQESPAGANLLVCWSGPLEVVADGFHRSEAGGPIDTPLTREWLLPGGSGREDNADVTLTAPGPGPTRVYEVEVGSPGRSAIRLANVEADVLRASWIVGVWDGAGREFTGSPWRCADVGLRTNDLTSDGKWLIRFNHEPQAGHRYYLIHGLIRGRSTIDIGDDGIVEWVAEQKGEEIVDFDATEMLAPGENVVAIETTGRHDFAALLEVCPGSTDLRRLPLSFEGDHLAECFTRVIDNTWFWLHELHYEPSGFLDASIPHGKWYGQFWPIDIAFALREWVRWGRQEEAERIARLTAEQGWHGNASNRSGGWDNTAGNIIVKLFAEILRRSRDDAELVDVLWPVIESHAREMLEKAESSPFGLIQGTNWENAGNHENGPCYALSTTLGAAQSLRQAADLAERLGKKMPVESWRTCADGLRKAALKRLVFSEDHRGPSGFVFPAGTWAYGLRPDGSVEDEPLAGYFWAGGGITDVEGLVSSDNALLDVYSRTLTAAVPLFEHGARGVVSGYSKSYGGAETTLVLAALCDRIDLFEPLLQAMREATDFDHDKGAPLGELSRWAQGGPGFEDTNLVGAGGFLWPLRIMAGIDDLLTDGRQLRLVPRLPWSWGRMHVNEWRVRCRDLSGEETWATLTFSYERDQTHARMALRASRPMADVSIRLGPFRKESTRATVTVNGKSAATNCVVSGDAAWVWASCDLSRETVTIDVRATQPGRGP